jgi:hypothetical protein
MLYVHDITVVMHRHWLTFCKYEAVTNRNLCRIYFVLFLAKIRIPGSRNIYRWKMWLIVKNILKFTDWKPKPDALIKIYIYITSYSFRGVTYHCSHHPFLPLYIKEWQKYYDVCSVNGLVKILAFFNEQILKSVAKILMHKIFKTTFHQISTMQQSNGQRTQKVTRFSRTT